VSSTPPTKRSGRPASSRWITTAWTCDFVIMEEDDGTNYKEIAKSTATIALNSFGQEN
jgi:hypothetical protein